jgi:hypothetical protein
VQSCYPFSGVALPVGGKSVHISWREFLSPAQETSKFFVLREILTKNLTLALP